MEGVSGKRGPGDLYSGEAQTFVDDGSSKRAKVGSDNPPPPSRVLHIRNLPTDCTEYELQALAGVFGKVEQILILKGKNQAFLQMADVTPAAALMHYYSSVQANVRGRPIYFQYSTRETISTPAPTNEVANHILLVNVSQQLYPISIEDLYSIFSRYGTIAKIIIFNKNANFQSLIQFLNKEDAAAAKAALNGQNIYHGCCTLRINYSNLPDLTVKQNTDRTRDFMNPDIAPAVPNAPTPNLLNTPGASTVLPPRPGAAPQTSSLLPSPSQPAATSGAGDAYNPYANPYDANAWAAYAGSSAAAGYPAGYPYVASPSVPVGPNANVSQTCVLLVNNLEASIVTPDVLFTLFGCYGDPVRVKLLYQKPGTALVQFATPQQAQVALENLAGCPLFGKSLVVNYSKHANIQMPKPGADINEVNMTKDFTGSPLHRFRGPNNKNMQNICPPSSVLHIANVGNILDEQYKIMFAQYGTVKAAKFFTHKEKRMGLVEMGSIAEAVSALVHMHNFEVTDGVRIKVSFSRNKVEPQHTPQQPQQYTQLM